MGGLEFCGSLWGVNVRNRATGIIAVVDWCSGQYSGLPVQQLLRTDSSCSTIATSSMTMLGEAGLVRNVVVWNGQFE